MDTINMTDDMMTAESAFAEARLARNELISYVTRSNAQLRSLEISMIERAQRSAEHEVRMRISRENRALRVLFLVPHTSLFDVFLPIYQRMQADPRFEPEVLSFRRVDITASESEDETRRFYSDHAIDAHVVGFGIDGFLPDLDPDHYDLLVYTLGSMAYPDKYRIETTSHRFLTCYVAYGFLQANQIEYQFNQPFHHLAWRIFAATAREQALYAFHSPRSRSNAVLTGYPKFDLYNKNDVIDRPTRPLVIWAPHWTIGYIYPQLNLGMFDRICMDMLSVFDDFPGIDFLFKPHPNLPYALEKTTFMNSASYKIYLDMLNARTNVSVWNHGDNIRLFQLSSAMITDSVSFLAEYLPSGEPLMFLDRSDRMPFADIGEEIARLHYRGDSIAQIRDFLTNIVIDKNDVLKTTRMERFPTLIGQTEKPASLAIIDHLADTLLREDAPTHGRSLGAQIEAYSAGESLRLAAANEVSNSYWLGQTSYNYATLFEARYRGQIAFTDEHFLPRLSESSSVIDIGCADGWHSVHVAAHCGSLTGYDLNPRFVELARENARAQNLENCRFEVANALTLALPTEQADAVIEGGLTTCFAKDNDALAALILAYDALKPGGVLLLKDTLSRGNEDKIHVTGGYAGCYRAVESYQRLIAEAGFHILAESWIDASDETGSYMVLAEKRDSV